MPVFKSGKGWGYVHDVPAPEGQRKQKKRRGFPTKAKALEALTASLYEYQNGLGAEPERITVGDYVRRYLETRRESLAPASLRRGYDILRNYIEPHLGALKVSELTHHHLDRFYLALRQAGLSPNTQAGVHQFLKQILKRGEGRREVRQGLYSGVDTPKRVRREYRVLTPGEQSKLLKGLEGRSVWLLVLILVTTGMRPGELVSLTWADVDLGAGLVHLPKERTKTRKARTVSLYPEVREALLKHRRELLGWAPFIPKFHEANLVFPKIDGRPWGVGNLSATFQNQAAKIPDVPKIRLYDLRHTHASDLLAAGVSVVDVAARLGHSPEMCLSVYAHAIKDGRDLARDLGAARFRAALAGDEPKPTGLHLVK